MNASDTTHSQSTLPNWLIATVVVVCSVPILLMQLGADFSSDRDRFDPAALVDADPATLEDALHRALSGSFTHTILEWSAFSVAILTVILSLVHFGIRRDPATPVLGVALFCAGCMDAFHTLAADRLIEAVAPNQDLIPYTWAIARLFNALILIAGAGIFLVRKEVRTGTTFVIETSVAFGAVAYGIIHYTAASPTLPQTMFEDAWVTRPYDVAPLVLYVIAGALIFPAFQKRSPGYFSHAMVISTIPQVVTQLHMSFGSFQLFDSHFNVAHFLKIITYLVPFAGLSLDYIRTHRQELEVTRNRESLVRIGNAIQQITRPEDLGHVMSVCLTDGSIGAGIEAMAIHRVVSQDPPSVETYRVGRSGPLGPPVTRRSAGLIDKWKLGKPEINADIQRRDPGLHTLLAERFGGLSVLSNANVPFSNGVLSAQSSKPFAFNDRVVGTLSGIGDLFAIAFSRVADMGALESQNKELEVAMRDAQAANEAKSQFLANMSHEIRTPLNGILGMTDLALAATNNPETREYLTAVKQSGDGLLQLLNDILDFEKIEAGKLEFDAHDFEIRNAVHAVETGLRVQAERKDIKLDCTVSDHVPRYLRGDSHRFLQILVNLGSNAIKFTSEGSVSILIEPDPSVGDNHQLRVSVRDTGIGIAREKLDDIFEAFSQADGSMTRKYGGTGLGLAIATQLVRQFGGRIWVESEPEKGSTFHFTVRFEPSDGAPTDAYMPTPEAVRPLRILLAEDNAVNQKVAAGLLRKQGHAVDIAGNGREAVEALDRSDYDVVLMIIQMPEMDGVEATRSIRKKEAGSGRHLPIIAMTAHAMEGDREKYVAAGMDGYVAKPVSIDRMIGEIVSCLGEATTDLSATHVPAAETTMGLDVDALATRTGGMEILAEIAGMFVEACPDSLDDIRQAIADGDGPAVQKAAHKLKGSLLVFELGEAAEIAYQVENAGEDGRMDEARGRLEELEREIDRVIPMVRDLAGA